MQTLAHEPNQLPLTLPLATTGAPPMPTPPASTAPLSSTLWGWATNPKQSALDNLTAAIRYYRLVHGGELVAVMLRAELAEQLPADLPLTVVASDDVPANSMYFTRAGS